jgi:hypothetical protein
MRQRQASAADPKKVKKIDFDFCLFFLYFWLRLLDAVLMNIILPCSSFGSEYLLSYNMTRNETAHRFYLVPVLKIPPLGKCTQNRKMIWHFYGKTKKKLP